MTVWVPIERPASVTTRAGRHSGDITRFVLETEEAYVTVRYEPGAGGLGWHRGARTPKGSETAEEIVADGYEPVAGEGSR